MHRLQLLTIVLVASFASAQDPVSGIVRSLFARVRSKSAESSRASLVELGIGEHARDTSKIVNITDSNWEDYLGYQSTGEWLVEFTVQPELCPSCELIDLAFNDASHRLAIAYPELHIGRVDCTDEIILSTRFIVTKPPILYHITPATRTIRRIPPSVGRPDDLVSYYDKQQWRQISPWLGAFNPLGQGYVPAFVEYAGTALKMYTRAVDGVPRWLGLLIIGVLSSLIMKWLHSPTLPQQQSQIASPSNHKRYLVQE